MVVVVGGMQWSLWSSLALALPSSSPSSCPLSLSCSRCHVPVLALSSLSCPHPRLVLAVVSPSSPCPHRSPLSLPCWYRDVVDVDIFTMALALDVASPLSPSLPWHWPCMSVVVVGVMAIAVIVIFAMALAMRVASTMLVVVVVEVVTIAIFAMALAMHVASTMLVVVVVVMVWVMTLVGHVIVVTFAMETSSSSSSLPWHWPSALCHCRRRLCCAGAETWLLCACGKVRVGAKRGWVVVVVCCRRVSGC